MSKYTIKDVANIVPQDLTSSQIQGVEDYLNKGIIPPFDPCGSCEPNFIRKLISLIQVAERNGYFPPKRVAKPKPQKAKEELVADGYVAGIIGKEELDSIKAKRPEMFAPEELDELEKDLIEQEILDDNNE